MKAVIVTGPGADKMEIQEVKDPSIESENQILIRTQATGVNPVDHQVRDAGGFFPDAVPFILGCDGAGIVDAIGANVDRFKVGDEVFFMNAGCGGDDQGTYAELSVLDQDYVALKPKSLTMAEASTVPLAWMTAWEALVDRSNLKTGQIVLVQAGAGGVGYLAIQIAKYLGTTVFTTISSDEKANFAKSIGADHCINYKTANVVKEVLNLTDGVGVDVVFDTVGGDIIGNSIPATKVYGHLTTLEEIQCTPEQIGLLKLRNLSLSYELMLTPMFFKMHEARKIKRKCLKMQLHSLIREKLKLNKTFEITKVHHAHQLIKEGHAQGKVAL
jgi:NADPH2:quinone reductase